MNNFNYIECICRALGVPKEILYGERSMTTIEMLKDKARELGLTSVTASIYNEKLDYDSDIRWFRVKANLAFIHEIEELAEFAMILPNVIRIKVYTPKIEGELAEWMIALSVKFNEATDQGVEYVRVIQ